MQVIPRSVNGISILDLAGRLVWADPDRISVRAAISKMASEGRANVLVRLSRVTDIDAHGLGELASSCAMVRGWGGQMALIAPRGRVRRLLSLTRLDTVLPIYESEEEALTSAAVDMVIATSSVHVH